MPKTFSQTVKQENKKSEVEQFANMAWVKGGNFLRGSSFKENQAALKCVVSTTDPVNCGGFLTSSL